MTWSDKDYKLIGPSVPETDKNMEILAKDFDGVFRFTNVTDEDFVAFWNNKEYTFPAGKTVPLIIPDESALNVQEIRKMFAYKLASREFYKGKIYKDLVKQGNKSAGGMPPIFDEKILEPMIEECLKPLPESRATVREGKKDNTRYKASKAVKDNENLAEVFKDEPVETRGKMPDSAI
jgi:hypothetical protein